VLELDHTSIYVIHDIAELDLVPEDAGFSAVVFGHSHHPSAETRRGVTFVNPGSAGPARFSLPISLARMYVNAGAVEVELITLR